MASINDDEEEKSESESNEDSMEEECTNEDANMCFMDLEEHHKDKSSQGEIMKKKTTSKRSVFQDSSFIRSLCKVVGALGFSCITFFTYALKSFKSYFVLNILKIG